MNPAHIATILVYLVLSCASLVSIPLISTTESSSLYPLNPCTASQYADPRNHSTNAHVKPLRPCQVLTEAAFSAMLLKESCKLVASVLATTIRPEQLDWCTMLSVHPGYKCLVSLQSLILSAQELQPCVVSAVISECDIVSMASQAR